MKILPLINYEIIKNNWFIQFHLNYKLLTKWVYNCVLNLEYENVTILNSFFFSAYRLK